MILGVSCGSVALIRSDSGRVSSLTESKRLLPYELESEEEGMFGSKLYGYISDLFQ
jgi:hypothetical protein